jgi:hypothetical protein
MNSGDLVTNEYNDIGIIIRQVGIINRWVVKWMTGSNTEYGTGTRAHWGHDLYLLDSFET